MFEDTPIVLGPPLIASIGRSLQTLMPWLEQSKFRVLKNGNLEFTHAEPAEAVGLLRGAVEEGIPAHIQEQIGRSSGLGWKVFFGHVVTWWLQNRARMGFLGALVHLAALHKVKLRLHWNQDRVVAVKRVPPGAEALWWGGGFGIAAGIGLSVLMPFDSLPGLLAVGVGLVGGRLYQRVARLRYCGDELCRAQLHRLSVCPTCGGLSADRQ